MKNCTYIFNGKTRTYLDLMSDLKSNISDVYDILYSKDENILSRIVDRLQELKLIGKTKKRADISTDPHLLDGCADVNISDFSLLTFIDSGLYNDLQGNPIMKKINIEDYIERMKLLYASNNIPKEEIERRCDILKSSWKRIAKDGGDLHKIVLNIHGDSTTYSDVVELTKGTSFAHLSDVIYDKVEKNIYKEVKKKHGLESREYGDTSSPTLIKNINLTAKINGTDKTVTAHIDYVIINPDGSLDIFNIKSSHEGHAFWDEEKKVKYKHEFALISLILLHNGVDTKNIRFNVVPVVLEYNDTYTDITDITVSNAECYSHNAGAFIMLEYLKYAGLYITSNVKIPEISNESLERVNRLLSAVFPELGIKAEGVKLTIKDYIDTNWKYWVQGPLPATGYSLNINGVHYDIKDSRSKSENEEVYRIIELQSEELIDNYTGELSASSLISQIKQLRRNAYPSFNNYYLDLFFLPYFEHTTIKENGVEKYNYAWEVVENEALSRANIIMFKNKLGQINVICLTNLDINKGLEMNHHKNILGYHLSDANASDYQGHALMPSTYGNLETMRALFLLNEIIPNLGQDIKLGEISVLGGLGTDLKSQTYPIQMITSNFVKALDVVFKNEDEKVDNNLKTVKHISPVELLINEYWNILLSNASLTNTDFNQLKNLISGSSTDAKQHLLNGEVIDSLASAETNEIRILRLEELIIKLNTILKNQLHISLDPDNLIKLASPNNHNVLIRSCSLLLLNATITLDRLSGIIRISELDMNNFDEILARPLNLANTLVRIVGKLMLDAIHNTSQRLDAEVSDFNIACLEYYKAKGYTSFENAVIGDLVRVFKHLYRDNADELFLKNPYAPDSDLDAADKKFLKKVLFIFNKIRFLDLNFVYKDENDPALLTFIKDHKEYFWTPLERASSASRWRNPIKYAEDFKRRAYSYCKNPGLLFKELYEGVLTEALEKTLNQDIEDMQAHNPFKMSNVDKGRQRLFRSYPKEYFETNLLNLVIDYLHKDILEKEMNKMLMRTKGILLYLKLTGERDNDPEKFIKVINYIDDYLKVSVFNKSIMEEDTKKLDMRLRPLRKALTKVYIAASPVAAVRDVLGGFLSNNMRALTNFRTNIDVKDVLWAYLFVLRLGMHTALDIDLLDKLNSRYLISNINLESPQEGYKTNRGGILNADNWMYATLRKPDFLNRMVLFMAQLKHDGSYEAYSIVNLKLVYNWRKDKRFNLLANNDTSDMAKYNEQKALYLSLLVKFNLENPGSNLEVSLKTDLPDGYTLNQIDNVKNLADTIYGSYNKSTKAKYENLFLGSLLGAFSTWMNGVYDVYFGKRRESSYETVQVLKRNEAGLLLWIDPETGNITEFNTGIPLYDDIPLIVLGVFRTLGDVLQILAHSKDFKSALTGLKTEIYKNPMLRRNITRLLTDLLVWFLLHELFSLEIDPAYKEHKKNGDGEQVVANAILEILYKGSSSCFEEFKGPAPIIDYVTNNTKPAAWQWSLRMVNDVVNVTFGDKEVSDFILGMLAFPRSFLDTYKMYCRDTAHGVDQEDKD